MAPGMAPGPGTGWHRCCAPFADAAVRLSYLKCAQNPNPGFKNVAAAVQKNPRFRYADVDGHHNVMLINPERLTASLLALG
jgi:hypothetical protein